MTFKSLGQITEMGKEANGKTKLMSAPLQRDEAAIVLLEF